LIFLFLCLSNFNIFGQSKPSLICNGQLNGFISDGQEYILDTKETSKIDVIFYSGFTYRIKLCSEFKNIKLEFTLIDEKGNIQYENIIGSDFFRDFKFATLFHGKFLIKPINVENKFSAQILIGYKKI